MTKEQLIKTYGEKPLRDCAGILFNYTKSDSVEDLKSFNDFLKKNEPKKLNSILEKLFEYLEMQ